MNLEDEPTLVARLQRRDPAAFEAVYAAYHGRVFSFLSRLSRRPDIASDLCDEVWYRLVAHAGRLRPDTQLAPWLLTVARNLYFSYCRSRQLADAATAELAGSFPPASLEPSPERQASARDAGGRLERALRALSALDREALLLVGVEELSPRDAAIVCGVSAETFRQRLSRARARLAAAIARLEDAHGGAVGR